MNRFLGAIDRISGGVGAIARWLTLGMVLIGAFNAIVRYLDRFTGWGLSSNTYIELQWYLFAVVFLLGASYALREEAHVRVDVVYGRFGARGKAWVNLLGTVLFLIPFCVLVIVVSIPAVKNSWAVMEQSPDPGGLARYPIKTLTPIAFFFLLLQGLAMLARSVVVLRSGGEDASEGDTSEDDASPTDSAEGAAV